MNKNKVIVWLPRAISIAFVLFLSLFSLDVFSEYSGWEAVVPFLIHMIPSIVLLAIVLLSFKFELIGALVFLAFAVFYVVSAGLDKPWTWYAFISGPAVITSALFFLSWMQKRKIK
jgi:uncharacterized membrane protein